MDQGDQNGQPAAGEKAPEARRTRDGTRLGIALAVFLLGVMSGVPLALFGFEFFVDNAFLIFAVLVALLVLASLIVAVVVTFRRPILRTVVRRSDVEMERFAGPLANVARFAAEQRVNEATEAARELGELMLARYAWVATRRWMVATITAFIAAIATLAGSALLFQQNQLLRGQTALLQEQTDRLTDQNGLIGQQIQLGDAERATTIVPEILTIGALMGAETAALEKDGRKAPLFLDAELSRPLRARIVAATNAARPYRYLDQGLTRASDQDINAMALARRIDLGKVQRGIADWRASAAELDATGDGGLIDRPVSPERGQLLVSMFNLRVLTTETLTFNGADFSFAEVHAQSFGNMSMKHANLRFADFSRTQLRYMKFGAAYLDQARFRQSVIANSDFSGIASADIALPQQADPSVPMWYTHMVGADFRGAVISDSDFSNSLGAAIDFDGAMVFDADFLGKLEVDAAPGTFRRDRFEIVPVSANELAAAPNFVQLTNMDGFDPSAKAYRIKRVKPFEDRAS